MRKIGVKEIFKDIFWGGDKVFYVLCILTFPLGFLYFLICLIGGVEEVEDEEI